VLPPGSSPTFDPVSQPTTVVVAGLSSQHQTEYDVPAGAPGSSVCGSADGWTASGRTYRYRNGSGFVYVAASPTPYCLGGTGLKQVKLTDDRTRKGQIKFSLTVDGANNLSAPGNEDAALLVELGSPQGCAGALIHCVASPGKSSCK
jgi:hypothetical protein